MNKKDLVLENIDRNNELIISGEILIDWQFSQKFVGNQTSDEFNCIRETLSQLGHDIVTIHFDKHCLEEETLNKRLQLLKKWEKEELLIIAMVDGPFSLLCDEEGWTAVLTESAKDPELVKRELIKKSKNIINITQEILNQNIEVIITGEDLAYSDRTFLSPTEIKNQIFPALENIIYFIKEQAGTGFIHSCGNIETLIKDLINLGFDGIHGLQSSAGIDMIGIKEKYSNDLIIWGNFEPDLWNENFDEEKIASEVRNIINSCRRGGGYIAGTSTGLHAGTDIDKLNFLYDLIRKEKEKN